MDMYVSACVHVCATIKHLLTGRALCNLIKISNGRLWGGAH